ncbi:MAG: insulinase family protein [Candidatus Gastranaerophilales bacterium]|nr:insulinase family protein [Candidatus Gastranaerophilales bacterium]
MNVTGMQIPAYQRPIYNNYDGSALTSPVPYTQTSHAMFVYPSNYYTVQNNNTNAAQSGANWKLDEIEQTPYGDNIYKYTLKNGQTVVLMPRKDATTIIKTFVDAGSMNENDENRGISHFNEHNVFNGSKHLEAGKFFKEVGSLGADTNASTDYAQTDFYIMAPVVEDNDLEKIIQMHADMLVNPLFPEDMVEKEKGPVTSEISMVNDNTASRAINSLIKNLFQINSNSTDLVAGSIETVNNITRDDVYEHWRKHFTPDNMYTVLTGDFNPDEAIEIISQNFTTPYVENADSMRTKEKLTPIQQSVRTDYISPTDASTNVFCAFAGYTPDNVKDSIALNALGLLLFGNSGARLTKSLDEIYAAGDFSTQKVGLEKTDPNALIFQFATQGGDDSKALDKFYEAVKSLETTLPAEDEMLIVKNTLLKSLAASFEDSETITDTIGSSLLGGYFSNISEYKNIIENLTPNDLIEVSKKYLDFNKMSVAVVHPYNMTEDEIIKNYNNSKYSFSSLNQNAISNNGQINFTGRKVSADNVETCILPDNSACSLNNYDSENCYFDWRLTSKDTIPDNPACAYVLTQILNDGSKDKSKADFSLEANKNSVSYDVDTNAFQIHASANCLYQNTEDAIRTLKEAIYSPRITQEDFDAAVNKIRTYCSSMNKDASTNLLARLYGKYFPSPKQILEGLETLTLDDVKKMYNNLIFNSSSNIVVSAPFEEHPELKSAVKNGMNTPNVQFKPYAPKLMQSYIPNDKEVVLLDTEERNQAQIYKNYSFEISGNIEDEIKFELLNTILGGNPSSRLFQDLREKQKLAYTVSSQIQSFENSGILTMRILSTTDDKKQNDIKYDNLQKSLDGFEEHTNRLMNEYVTDEELEAAKMQLKQDIAAQMELPYSAVSLLSMNMTQPGGIKRIDEYVNTIDKITKQDIKDAANHIFKNKPVYSILASEDTVNNQMSYINSLGEVLQV